MARAARKNELMPHTMRVGESSIECVEHDAGGVEDSTRREPGQSRRRPARAAGALRRNIARAA